MPKLDPKTHAKFKVMLEKRKLEKKAVASKIRARLGQLRSPGK